MSWTGTGPSTSMSLREPLGPALLREHPLAGAVDRLGEARFRTRARPAHREVQGDRARFEPEIAGLADPLDEVDRLDLAGLREQDPEPRRADPGQVVGGTGVPAERVGERRQDPVAGLTTECRDEAFEAIQLDDDHGRRMPVAADPGILVGHEAVPLVEGQQAGQRIRPAGRRDAPGRQR